MEFAELERFNVLVPFVHSLVWSFVHDYSNSLSFLHLFILLYSFEGVAGLFNCLKCEGTTSVRAVYDLRARDK